MDQATVLPESSEVVRRRSLTDEVYDHLYRRIIAGKYSPGDWLRQEDISSQLGVSQTPVREALDRLVAASLAERVPYRGVRVPILEAREVLDAFMMRLVLENLAARLAVLVIQPDEVEALTKLIEQTANLLSLEDISTLRQLNKEFHTHMVESAHVPMLSKLYDMVTNSFPDWMLYEYMFRHPELLESSLKREYLEHKGIIEALAAHDAQAAATMVTDHIKNLGSELETYLEISGKDLREMITQIEPMISLKRNQ